MTKRDLALLLATAAFAVRCAGSAPAPPPPAPAAAPSPTPTPTPVPERDGSSLELAIPILESTERAGILAERAWLQEHFPGAQRKRKSLQTVEGRRFDVVVLELPDGTEKTIYFDINAFYGFH